MVEKNKLFVSITSFIDSLLKLIKHYFFDSKLFQVASWAFVIRFIGAGCSFGLTVLIGRKLGAAGSGLYFLCLTVTMISSVIGRLGLDNAILRLIASAAADKDWSLVLSIYRSARRVSLIASTSIVIIIFSLAHVIANAIFSEPLLAHPLRWMALSIIPLSLITLQAEAFKALPATRLAIFFQNVSIPLFCLVVLAMLGDPAISVVTICQVYFAATLIIVGAGGVIWYQKIPHIRGEKLYYPFKSLLTLSIPFLWISVLNLLMGWMGTLALGVWQSSEVVGLYSVANRTVALAGLILTVVNTVVAPRFASLYSQGNLDGLQRLANRSMLVMTTVAIPMVVIFMFFAEDILRIFGSEFIIASPVLKILALGQFVNVATGSVGYLLMMTGHEKVMRNNIIFASIINVLLTLILVPTHGATGAAIAAAISLIIMNMTSLYLVIKILKVNIFLFK
jgi:O-antigen/teichoic acid export membrane protein